MPGSSKSHWKALSTFGAVYFVLVVLYGNVAVILNASPLRPNVPKVDFGLDLFNLFGVFSTYETHKARIFIEGLGPDNEWIALSPQAFFPQPRGEAQLRLMANRHYQAGDETAQRQAYQRLAGKILHRQNHLHPENPIKRVRFGLVTWPVHPAVAIVRDITPMETRTLLYTQPSAL